LVPNTYIIRYVKEHYVQKKIRREIYEAFIKWCGENSVNICLEKALKILGANIGANPPSESAQQSKPPTTAETSTAKVGEQKPQIHTFCRKKDSIKYFKAFLDWVDRNYKVVDWWEEGDSYCFETEKPPKS
jgi:hypothetical protein